MSEEEFKQRGAQWLSKYDTDGDATDCELDGTESDKEAARRVHLWANAKTLLFHNSLWKVEYALRLLELKGLQDLEGEQRERAELAMHDKWRERAIYDMRRIALNHDDLKHQSIVLVNNFFFAQNWLRIVASEATRLATECMDDGVRAGSRRMRSLMLRRSW